MDDTEIYLNVKDITEPYIIKKVYHISGFDCANCATQVETYLNSKEEISYAKIDFSANKLYITYKNNPWTIEELVKVIEEVESDSLEIYEEGNLLTRTITRKCTSGHCHHQHNHNHKDAHCHTVPLKEENKNVKKIYHISGFDCANCAAQLEMHLNNKEEISYAKIDFSANKLYITYKQKPWTIIELVKAIEEVEPDSLKIYEIDNILTRTFTRKSTCGHCSHKHNHNLKDTHSHIHHDHEHEENKNVKKIYHISGFDCANCATQVESHLNNKDEISYAKIDFSANKLYITYKQKPWTIKELVKVIEEVESDSLEIYEEGNLLTRTITRKSTCGHCSHKHNHNLEETHIHTYTEHDHIHTDHDHVHHELKKGKKNQKEGTIMTKDMWILSGRIAFGIIMICVLVFVLGNKKFRWIRFGLYLGTFCILAYDIFWKVVLHFRTKINRLDHNLLIMIAGIGAFGLFIFDNIRIEEDNYYELEKGYTIALDEGMEANLVVILFQIGHMIESYATNKSKAEVMRAVELRVETANLIKNDQILVVTPEELHIGDKILVKVGELIPIDGIILEGEAFIDTSSLTGEFIPEKAKIGMNVFSGCLIKEGQIIVEVKKKYADSTVSKILELITSGGEKKSRADEFVDKFSRYYTPIVVIVSIIAIIIFGCATKKWEKSICQGLEILVAGCPCAIVISIPLAYFSAIGLSSKNGIIVKGSSYLDKLIDMKKLVTDKTGTLTKGTFSIQVIKPYNCTQEELLNNLYIIESLSNHPLAKTIIGEQNLGHIAAKVEHFEEKAGYGVSGIYELKKIYAGTKTFLESFGIEVIKAEEIGTVIYVGVDKTFMGYVVLSDEIKNNSEKMIELLHQEGIEVILLTGDREDNAKEITTKLNIDRFYSNLLPEQKTTILESEMDRKKYAVAFVGDGINDAPSIKLSDIGFAMGGIGSDIAVQNADIVIMNDDPIKIYYALKIAKIARNVSLFNIIFSLVVKAAVVGLISAQEFIAHFSFKMYYAVLADTGLTILMVLNSLFILYRKITI